MKIIKYNFSTIINVGTEATPQYEEVFSAVEMPYSEENLSIAEHEAHNGEYTIEQKTEDSFTVPTTQERLAALEAALLEMMGVTANG